MAFSWALTASAVVRTSLDCDGNTTPEVQNTTVTGPANWDIDVTTPSVAATTFTCTLDNGGTSGPNADFAAFCEA